MSSLFGEERLEFFHLPSIIATMWRSQSKWERLLAADADEWAVKALGYAAAFRREIPLTDTPTWGRLFGTFCMRLEIDMAAKKAPPPPTRESAPEWKGFLEYRLSDEELEELDSWSPDAGELMEALHTMLVGGYTFTLSWSPRTEQACFSLRDQNHERKTAGYCMTTFDTNCALALKAGVYKQRLVLKDDWTPLLKAGKPVRRG